MNKHTFRNRVLLATTIGALCVTGAMGTGIANSKININLDGKLLTQTTDMGFAYMNDQYGRTMVPLRLVSEEMGYDVKWDKQTQTATIVENGTTVKIAIGSQSPTVNGVTKTIDAPAALKDNRTYVPVRFISEAMGAEVDYKNRTVMIETDSRIPLPEVAAIPGKATYNNDVDFKVITEYFGKHQYPGVNTPVYLDNGNNIVFKVDPYQPEWDKGEPFDVQIKIKGYASDETVALVPTEYQNRYQEPKAVIKEVLKFYLPNGYEKLFDIVDDGYNNRLDKPGSEYMNKDLRPIIGSDGKKVQIVSDDGFCIRISK